MRSDTFKQLEEDEKRFNPAAFADLWNAASSISEVMRLTGFSRSEVIAKAMYVKTSGTPLVDLPMRQRTWKGTE